MANVPQVITTPFPYSDSIQIGPDVCPGKVTVENGKRPSGWDERKGYGLSGATLWPVGDPLGHFAILIELWDENDYDPYLAFYKKYLAPEAKIVPGSKIQPGLNVTHPVLHQLGLQQCVVIDRDALTKDDYGLWSQRIYFKQYRKPKPAPQPPIATIPAAAAPQPTAQSAQEKEAVALSNEYQGLVGP